MIADANTIEWVASGDTGVRLGRWAGGAIIEWPGIGHMLVPGHLDEATFVPAPGAAEWALKKFRATDLMACRRYLAGLESLHGSAVAWSAGVVGILGESGAGKSTMAMALVESGRGAFVSDDVLPLEFGAGGVVTEPVDDTFWLWPGSRVMFGIESATEAKLPVPPRVRSQAGAPLRLLVHLVFDDSVTAATLTRLRGQALFVVLSRAQVSFSFGAADAVLRDLDTRAKLSARVPVYELRRPRSASIEETAAFLAGRVETLLAGGVAP